MTTPRYDNPALALLAGVRDRLRGTPARALSDDERLDRRTALVTGANRGLGRAIAVGLAERGARLLLPCRSDGSGTLARVRAAGAEGELLWVDLADLDTVHRLADALRDRSPIDVLVLNAGVVPSSSRGTPQGFEIQNAVNYLANVLLVDRLLEDGALAPDARVIAISSESHRSTDRMELDRLGQADVYGVGGVMKRYSSSKLLLTSWALELGRRTGRSTYALCPGAVRTGIAQEAPAWSQPLLRPVMAAFFAPPELAARPVIYLACARAAAGGSGYFHRFEEKPASELARDRARAAELYDVSRALLRSRAPHPDTERAPAHGRTRRE